MNRVLTHLRCAALRLRQTPGFMLTFGMGVNAAVFGGGRNSLDRMLPRLSPSSSLVIYLAIAAMLVVADLAAYVPARRAASIEPMQALQTE